MENTSFEGGEYLVSPNQVYHMVIEQSTAFAMRCPTCGRLEVHQLNIFQLAGGNSHDFFCKCGSFKAAVIRKGAKYIAVKYYCLICDEVHSIITPRAEFWSKKRLHPLLCRETDLNLGYFGAEKLLKTELERQQEELDLMADELGFDDFADPEIMLEILDFLHDLAAAGSFYCECGSHDINIELLSDRLDLTCNNCGSARKISARSAEDFNELKDMEELVIKMATTTPVGPKTRQSKPRN